MSDNFFHHLASECIKLSKVTDIKISDIDNFFFKDLIMIRLGKHIIVLKAFPEASCIQLHAFNETILDNFIILISYIIENKITLTVPFYVQVNGDIVYSFKADIKNIVEKASDDSNEVFNAFDDSNEFCKASDDSNEFCNASDVNIEVLKASDDSNEFLNAFDDSNEFSKASDDCDIASKVTDDRNKFSKASDVINVSTKASDESNVNSKASDESNVDSKASDDSNLVAKASLVANLVLIKIPEDNSDDTLLKMIVFFSNFNIQIEVFFMTLC